MFSRIIYTIGKVTHYLAFGKNRLLVCGWIKFNEICHIFIIYDGSFSTLWQMPLRLYFSTNNNTNNIKVTLL